MKKFLPFLLVFFFAIRSLGQSYEVQANIQVLPPYSVFLSDYTSPVSNKLNVTLMVNGAANLDYNVKLKFSIKGEGITIQTSPGFMPTPVKLYAGTIESYTGADLSAYFDPANLVFSGITKEQFMKTGRLPEGIYQFSVQVVEYNRSIPVSYPASAMAWIILNDPPMWITPQANEKVKHQDPQNILFTWLPRHTGSPNSAFTTEYEFTMVEVHPDNRNPNDAINTAIPIYKTTTTNTSLIYGPAEAPLVVGRKYACRLRAYDREGKDLFKNQGYSEVLAFTYGSECSYPKNIKAEVTGYESVKLAWLPSSGNTEFHIRYRVKGKEGANWYNDKSYITNHTIKGLKPATYEVAVKSVCNSMEGTYSPVDTFTIPYKPKNDFQCSDQPQKQPLGKEVLKRQLKPRDTIRVSGFNIIVTDIQEQTAEGYTGKGVVQMRFMDNARLSASLRKVKVNEEYQVIAGEVTLDQAYVQTIDPQTKDKIDDVLTTLNQTTNNIDKYTDNAVKAIQGAEEVLATVQNLPDNIQNTIEDGKEKILQGKEMIANGDADGGMALLQKGKDMVKDGLTAIKNGTSGSSSGFGDGDNLKELIVKALQKDKSDNVHKAKVLLDSLTQAGTAREEAIKELKQEQDQVVLGGHSVIEIAEVLSVENPGDQISLSSEDIKTLKSNAQFKKYIESVEISDKLQTELETLLIALIAVNNLSKEDYVNVLVKNFRNNLEKLGKNMLKDALEGKDPDIEIRVKEFIKAEIQKAITDITKP